jgi:DNA helicase II / ATP-dependent DNA helicase PcrA
MCTRRTADARMSFLSQLNPVQRDAVRTVEGPVMIVAGAGSGKTRVLTYRVAYLLQCGVPPWNILALTFTNKAAREMRERIAQIVPDAAPQIWMGTFHATFARLLRRDAERIGFSRAFSIYDTDDAQHLIRQVMGDLGISAQQMTPASVRHAISAAKNRMMSLADFSNAAIDPVGRRVARVWEGYQRRLREANAMDFDDLLLHPITLFEAHPDVLERYRQQFRFVLVDEYQDTNQAQFQIVRRLAAEHRNLCVVGDDAQSIYAFRGADIRNILDFERHFADARIFRLEQNYRSTKMILQAADSVIKRNQAQIPKTLWTENAAGDPVTIIECADESDEAARIVHALAEEGRRRKLQLSDIAILYRTNAQSRAIEDALRRLGIPYAIVGGVEFYRRREIKDVLAYLRLIINPTDDEAFLRVVNTPARGIGDTTIARLRSLAADRNVTLLEAGADPPVDVLGSGPARRVGDFTRMIRRYAGLRSEMSSGELAGSLVNETGMLASLKEEGTADAQNRLENVQELLSAIAEYRPEDGQDTLEAFLSEAALVADVDGLDQTRNAVTLMTLHAAKGLEFPVVFLSGMEEGLFPSSQAMERDEVEEERRLCYVGMTRAMQKLTLTYAHSRMRWGERLEQLPSRFLAEIDEATVQHEGARRRAAAHTRVATGSSTARSAQPRAGQVASSKRRDLGRGSTGSTRSEYSQLQDESYSQIESAFIAGARVTHETFGRGKILGLQGSGDATRAVILFDSVGRKTLILKFAGLTLS